MKIGSDAWSVFMDSETTVSVKFVKKQKQMLNAWSMLFSRNGVYQMWLFSTQQFLECRDSLVVAGYW